MLLAVLTHDPTNFSRSASHLRHSPPKGINKLKIMSVVPGREEGSGECEGVREGVIDRPVLKRTKPVRRRRSSYDRCREG